MKIINMTIKNFRGLDIECNGIDDKTLFIGQNDTGKSNICYAILKVFSPEYRRKPLYSSDSSFSNNLPIFFEFIIELSNLTDQQKGLVQQYHYTKNGKMYMNVRMTSEYNMDIMQYEDKLCFGNDETDEFNIQTDRLNNLDKILSIVYITPTYDLNIEKRNYFNYKEVKKVENQLTLSPSIKETIDTLRNAIKDESAFSDVIADLNNLGDFGLIFEDLQFQLAPNIKTDNIFNSLDILNINSSGNQIDYIGDGKSKVLSMLLKSKTIDSDKCKIFIVEEPENHLYVLLQRYYLSSILSLSPHQTIITTHSPHIIDFEKINKIIKISKCLDENGQIINAVNTFNIVNDDFKEFGYLINSEIAEMIYYDKVILVEGYSEKYFYNLLTIKDARFRKYLTLNKIGVYSIGGIAFRTTKMLLTSLGINVYIKTDNDISKVKNSAKSRYTGIIRALSYITCEKRNEIISLLGFDETKDNKDLFTTEDNKSFIQVVEDKMVDISNILKSENILLSIHHDGFERDFLEYVGTDNYAEDLKLLNEAKLKNLHEYINERDIDISISNNNKDSIILGFVNSYEVFE